jgi:dTDP-4-dehydrorhamnose reductase
LPSVVVAQIVHDVIIPDSGVQALYHVDAEPTARFDLLKMVAEVYGKSIEILPDDSRQINRSLNADCLRAVKGSVVPEWPELVWTMHPYYSKVVN